MRRAGEMTDRTRSRHRLRAVLGWWWGGGGGGGGRGGGGRGRGTW